MSDCSNVFFENKDLVVLHKPANILSVRSRFHSTKPEPTVLDLYGELLPVHRLDREVEGLLIAAKNKKTQSICNSWFEKKEINKSYMALSCEVDLNLFEKLPFQAETISPKIGDSFHWTSTLLRGKKRSYEHTEGDKAETVASLAGITTLNSAKIYQWKLSPLTGRSHQLRFELAKHKHPILGDELYFAPLIPHYETGIALIANELDFSQCPNKDVLNLPDKISLNISWDIMLSRLDSNATHVAEKE
ncbi:MAG: RNA pseudouridine synthase [Bdellovibrionota bacterium]